MIVEITGLLQIIREKITMTTQEAIELAKKKLGKNITEQEAQDYMNGKAALPDEALDVVSGGGNCGSKTTCPKCGSTDLDKNRDFLGEGTEYECRTCGECWTN
jgi:predicted RNA-binding Zn-ribbon protein involved in translation (DUF1610 family)